ncbi:probable cytochrome P450 49a1 [Penaeus indicus]|uniref:probable cytochrome P450 49a1 n=1 Tax=Penaeus indicus TaxID=29960 RepID=UPI00300D668F
MASILRSSLLLRSSAPSAFSVRSISGTSSSKQEAISVPKFDSSARPTSEIPGPRCYPIVGTIPSMLLDPTFDNKQIHKFWEKMIKEYGPIVRMITPGMPSLVGLMNPDDCETVFRTTMENPVRHGFLSLKKIRDDEVNGYFEKKSGLLPENGEEWWRIRSRVQTPMLKVKNIASYLKSMDEVTLEFLDRIAAMQEEYGEMPSNFQTELYKWSLESVGLVALSRRLGCLDPNLTDDSEPMQLIHSANNIFEAMNDTEISAGMWRFFPTAAYRKLKANHQLFLEVADNNIQETEALLRAKTSKEDEELTLMESLLLMPGLSRKDVVTLILDMLFAGIDTTSHTVGFTLYLLARNPEVQARVQKEVDQVIGDHQGPLLPSHLAKFSYLKAVLKESHRIFPLTVGNARTLDKDTVLSGYIVPKGWMAITLNMLIGWDESVFPRAKEFIPERWLRHKPLGPIHPYASLPFGAGTRMCVGRRIAEQELYTFLARIMHRFTVDYKYEDMDVISKLVFAPSRPLRFTFTERR